MRKCEDLIKSVQQDGELRLRLVSDSRVVIRQNEVHV